MSLSTSQLNNYFSMFQKAQNMIQKQTMKDLNAQLNQYRKFGQNIALAIVAGLQDQNVAVTNALKKMIHSMFPNLAGTATYAKPVSHSTIRTGHVHPPTHHHPIVHHHRAQRPAHYSMSSPYSSNTGSIHYHDHYNVTAPRDASLDTQIKHAAFRNKHRHTNLRFTGNRYDG